MTVTTVGEAVDDILARFREPWLADYPSSDSLELPMVATFTRPSTSDIWARWYIVHTSGGQGSLADYQGDKLYDFSGQVFVEFFSPLRNGLKAAYDLAEYGLRAYRGKPASPLGIRFYRASIIDEGQGNGGDSAWWQVTVRADFEYEQIGR